MSSPEQIWVDQVGSVLETLNQGVIINDERRRIVFANSMLPEMIKMPAGELLGRSIVDLYPPQESPTADESVVTGERNLDEERARLHLLIDRSVSGCTSACTTHPHPFFGPLSPAEWAILMYKHLDHHLRQFQA